jgi:hypothetical protein
MLAFPFAGVPPDEDQGDRLLDARPRGAEALIKRSRRFTAVNRPTYTKIVASVRRFTWSGS